MVVHASLDEFETRARTGKVHTSVDADLRVVVALIDLARVTRQYLTHPFFTEANPNPSEQRQALVIAQRLLQLIKAVPE